MGQGTTYTGDPDTTGGNESVSYTPAGTNSDGAVGDHILTTAQIPSHNHSFTGSAVTSGDNNRGHTHTFSTGTVSADHRHWVATGGVSANHRHWRDNHTHSFRTWAGKLTGGSNTYWLPAQHDENILGSAMWGGGGGWSGYIEADHSHSCWSGWISANHTHSGTTNGINQNHTHSVTAAGTIGNKGGGEAHNHSFT